MNESLKKRKELLYGAATHTIKKRTKGKQNQIADTQSIVNTQPSTREAEQLRNWKHKTKDSSVSGLCTIEQLLLNDSSFAG